MVVVRAICLIAVLLLTLVACSTAFAVQVANLNEPGSDWTVTYEGDNPVFHWTAACWENGEMYLDIEYIGDAGGSTYFKLNGNKDSDPLVSQSTKNGSNTTWLDWHVDVINATIDRVDVPVVHKVGTGDAAANWLIQYTHNDGYSDGFGASWRGGSTSVANGQNLSVRFRWTPTGGPVTIRQYPTDTGAFIPEPSSVLALASGLASMGLAFIRKRSS
jgi:hypothetical protein